MRVRLARGALGCTLNAGFSWVLTGKATVCIRYIPPFLLHVDCFGSMYTIGRVKLHTLATTSYDQWDQDAERERNDQVRNAAWRIGDGSLN